MSFLEQLQKKRNILKPTSTTLTTPTGERFIENKLDPTKNMKLCEQSYGFVVDTKPDRACACILSDFLYMGSQDAVNWENIVDYRLTHILSIGVPMPIDKGTETLQNKFINCMDLPETSIFDGVVQEANKFIGTARSELGCVLVHCNAGVSRSASIVIAYLMLELGMSFAGAYALVKAKRGCIQPNAGFVEQLKKKDAENT